MNKHRKAVVLASGGIDSTTAMAVAKAEGCEIYCLSFDYGQRHVIELQSAKQAASVIGANEHKVICIDLRGIGGSALTGDMDVPKGREPDELERDIPVTYVPARNTIFLSFALAWAEVLQAPEIFIGVTAIDFSGYPDCRPEYIAAFEKMANLAIKEAVNGRLKIAIRTPLIHMKKSDIILKGLSLGIDYGITHSCYDPTVDGRACGRCDSCLLRKKGFREAGISDPTRYDP